MQDITEATRQVTRDWLTMVRNRTGKSFTFIAREAGIATSTLTRHMNDPDYPHILSTQTIAKIAARFGIAPPGGFTGGRVLESNAGFAEPEAAPYDPEGRPVGVSAAVAALVAGRTGCDPWVLATRALELAGYLPGDIVLLDLNRTAGAGDIVCAQVYDWDQGEAETVWRIFEPPYLIAASAERTHRRPLMVDHKSIILKGVVCGMFRV